MTTSAALLFGVFLLAMNGLFVAAEFALLAARRSRMEQLAAEGSRAASMAVGSLRELSVMLAGAQLGITAASFGLGHVAEPAVVALFEAAMGPLDLPAGVRHAVALVIALSIVVFLHMVVGEMAPKSWAISDPEGSTLVLIRPFRLFVVVLGPVIRLLNVLANGFVRLCGVQPQDERAMVHNAGDLSLLLNQSHQQGRLEGDQRDLLHRAMELSGLDAESAMIPRRDIVAVTAEADLAQLERVASETGRSRLPVYDGDDLDRIRGVVLVKDLLSVDETDRATVTAASLARPALITPESRRLEELMVEMREQAQHIAIVVDEYGSVTGLVALEDLIEELIGDFEDESDHTPLSASPAEDRTVVPGTTRPDELASLTGVALPDGDWETVAGYLIHTLGRLPREGDRVTIDGVELSARTMDAHRVVEVGVRRQVLPGG